MYIAMRKNGKELTDYNVFDKTSMEKMVEDTRIREMSAYRMFSAFGHISKDEADMLRLRAHGVNNPKCKAQYLYELPTPMRCIAPMEVVSGWQQDTLGVVLKHKTPLSSFELKNKLSATCRGRSRGHYPFYRNA